jgi:hypothetical protein
MQFPFGPLAPDAGANAAGVCVVANGVLPKIEGYGPAPQLVTPGGATALPAAPRGAITTIKRSGVTQVYFLTEATLQSLGTDYTWTQIEAGLSCTSGDDWSTEQFGNKLLYTNTTQGLRAYDIEAGGAAAAISGVAPREIFVCANMVFGLDCLDASGNRDNRLIRNSDFNDHTDWTGGAADYQPLENGGALICGVNLKNAAAVVFQENAMRLLQFGNAGGGALYTLQEIANGRGSVGAKSVVAFDGVVYFLATNGFYRFSLSGGLEPIGAGKTDAWFLGRVALADLPKVQGSIDPARKIVLWRYPMSGDASATVTENVIGYSWEFDRWFTMSVSMAYLSRIATPGYTWDSAGAIWATWDDMPAIPFDDRFWQGGGEVLAALDSSLKYAAFSGSAQAATLTSSTGNSPVTTLIGWATPIDDAAAGTLELGVADELSDTITWKTAAAKVSGGRVPLRGRGLNVAFRYNIAAGESWTYAKGIDHIKAAAGGPK